MDVAASHFAPLPPRRLRSIAIAVFAFAALQAQGQLTFRVLDWNVHRDFGGADSDTAAQPALAKIVNYLEPDIWTINEVGGSNSSFNATVAHDDVVNFIED